MSGLSRFFGPRTLASGRLEPFRGVPLAGVKGNGVANADGAGMYHCGVDTADPWLDRVMHPVELPVDEPACILVAREREERQFGDQFATFDQGSARRFSPIDSGDRDVFPRRSGVQRMTFIAQGVNGFQRPKTQCLPRAAMMDPTSLGVAPYPPKSDDRLFDGEFRNAAFGYV